MWHKLHHQKLRAALTAMNMTYDHWLKYKDNHHPLSRGMALKAKTYGLIAYDTIMLHGR